MGLHVAQMPKKPKLIKLRKDEIWGLSEVTKQIFNQAAGWYPINSLLLGQCIKIIASEEVLELFKPTVHNRIAAALRKHYSGPVIIYYATISEFEKYNAGKLKNYETRMKAWNANEKIRMERK
jgi:hypothetical protein